MHARQEARRGAGRGDGIAPLVDQVVDAHEEPSGLGHELPDAGGACLGVRPEVEARLDEREADELDREALLAEDALHLGEVGARDADALGEALAESTLTVQPLVVRGGQEAIGRRVVGPQVVDRTLLCGERLRLRPRGVEAEQQRTQAVELDVGLEALEARELALTEAVVEAGAEVEDLVDLVEMDRVVQNHLVRRVLGEDGAPEADLRLELRGAREEVRLTYVHGGLVLRGADAGGRSQGGKQRC